ncbi:uncharacterized protein LOC131229523 [Magnolia sinica]|uniref:uncharacterized protein LOC131229523 n=1 Tax=Magnolia sinica TaxID=86752 RepID=UPI002658B1BB|nr:uncharacterized protein LOC131229523 [Magnolia sinica]
MDVRKKFERVKFHLIFAVAVTLLLAPIFYPSPSLLNVISYFWPLFLSTALFLAAVFVFGRISPPPSDTSGDFKAGEDLIDYVAGKPFVAEMEEEAKAEAEAEAETETVAEANDLKSL